MTRASARRIAVAGGAVLAACATGLGEQDVAIDRIAARWLPAIQVGITSVAELERRLGPPTTTFGAAEHCWVLVPVDADARVDVRDDGCCPSMASLGGGAARTAHRAELLRNGECRVVAAADLAARCLWPTVREAEFHLVVVAGGDGRVARWSLVRVLP